MRKYQQIKILELLQTLDEAHSELLKQSSPTLVTSLLADCQDFAVAICKYIEDINGAETKTIKLLEEYCEIAFRINAGEIGKKALGNQLAKIENSVKTVLKPNKIEILFISYKASMSDSIESIYLAAKNDSSCVPIFLPVPYFDVNLDNSLGKMRYEGAEYYGNNIEVTDYRYYDIEAHHPDVIFTFNPYDEWNTVTRVHPDYFCQRLHNCTDLLVYIPYFVVADDIDKDFITLPGCAYAHKVIVQSEKVRDTCVREFKNAFGDRLGKPEEKFLSLGSPKFDKVISTKRENCILPNEWARLIDGKKVILYNTSISTILDGGEQCLKKLRYVFEEFRRSGDVVLWWRPHPLSESTYASMRPKLLDEYRAIVAEYRRDGFGVYDDTPDLHRAIACSDAYYGDWSSLVSMYAATGNPMMLQNVYYHPENKYCQALQFENLYDDGQYLWFTHFSLNALFRMDKSNWKAEYVGSFPGEKIVELRQYRTIIEYNGKLYFTPGSAKQIGVYDINTGSFDSIPFESSKNESGVSEFRFNSAFLYGAKIFFAGYKYPAILCCDTLNGQITRFDDWIALLEPFKPLSDASYFFRGTAVGNKLFLPLCGADAVVEFNMDDGTSKINTLNSGALGFDGICFFGEHAWLIPRFGGTVVRWNTSNNEILKYEIPNAKCEYPNVSDTSKLLSYGFWVQADEYIYLFPIVSNRAVKINTLNGEITTADAFQQECGNDPLYFSYFPNAYLTANLLNNRIYAKTGRSNTFIEYDLTTNLRREEHIAHPNEIYELFRKWNLSAIEEYGTRTTIAECYFYDSLFFDMTSFIYYITHNTGSAAALALRRQQLDAASAACGRIDGMSGKAIYDYCVRECKV